MTDIRVAHEGADYEVAVGDLAKSLPRVKAMANGSSLPIISDERVFGLFGHRLEELLLYPPILVSEGEAAKDWRALSEVISALASLGVKRGTPIIALGGGSIGDLAGLAASLFKRGCPIVHVPTTLLAQVDSAIGGKTAIDAAGQKNLAGTFHHPALVIIDPSLLETLDARQMRSGYAEVLKYGLIDDPQFYAWCEENGPDLLKGSRAVRIAAIEHCVRAKARFVTEDPNDTFGRRALLNFGHTFGHAIEAVAGHGVLHGEAVAVGMALAFNLSAELSLCRVDEGEQVRAHLERVGLPASLEGIGLQGQGAQVFASMLSDKKAVTTGLTMILTKGIGRAFVAKDVDLSRLRQFLNGFG